MAKSLRNNRIKTQKNLRSKSMRGGGGAHVRYVKALYDYSSDNQKMVSLSKDDIIVELKKNDDSGWSLGINLGQDGLNTEPMVGSYPTNYVGPIANEPKSRRSSRSSVSSRPAKVQLTELTELTKGLLARKARLLANKN